jgi:ABC-type lipoprotein release transport system permease subunit
MGCKRLMNMRYVLKYAIRALTRRPLFTGAAVLTLVGALALTSSLIPARRIAGVSPQDALRVE